MRRVARSRRSRIGFGRARQGFEVLDAGRDEGGEAGRLRQALQVAEHGAVGGRRANVVLLPGVVSVVKDSSKPLAQAKGGMQAMIRENDRRCLDD